MNLLFGRLLTASRMIIYFGLMVLTTPISAQAQAKNIQDFFGIFLGKLVSDSSGGTLERDLKLVIQPHKKNGFSLKWTTIIHLDNGTDKIKNLHAKFAELKRPGIYASEMAQDLFGNFIPLDPLEGEPFYWAGLKGDTLTVHTLFIHANGGYEMHIYKRRLIDNTIQVEFKRVINGEPEKTLTAVLKRTKNCDWNWHCTNDNKCSWHAKNCRG